MAIDLRTGLDLAALAGFESVDDFFQTFRRQILIGILEDDDHGSVDAGALTLDFFPGERAFGIEREGIVMDLLLTDLHQIFRAAQHAGRGAADLDMGTGADRLQLELGVEGRNLEHADIGHAELGRDMLDCSARDPAVLFLCPHEQRDDSGLLTACRVFPDRCLCPDGIFLVKGEITRLKLVFG